jgi:hypothetical protein
MQNKTLFWGSLVAKEAPPNTSHQNAGQDHNTKIADKSFGSMETF